MSRLRRLLRRLLLILAVLVVLLWGIYQWQPQRYDFIPRKLPPVNPWTDPESADLFRPGTQVAVITAHPDDAEFYIGGLLTRLGETGAAISLIVATDGDKGYYPFADAEGNRRTRQAEQREAGKRYHAREIVFLGYPDGRLQVTPELVSRLSQELKRLQPEYILAFDPEYPPRLSHRDHRRAGEAAVEAVRQAGAGKWLLHFSTRAPNFAVDVSREWPQKMALLAIHRSQFYGERLKRIESMVSGRGREDGRLAGVEFGEGLRCVRVGR